MALNRERITLNPLEESTTSIPLEIGGDRFGHGIFVQQSGSNWAPQPNETPQISQSVDTEGGVPVATTIGLRNSPVIQIQVIEPNDPADTNYISAPVNGALGSSGQGGYTQNAATGAMITQSIYDLAAIDYAMLQICPGVNASEGLTWSAIPVGPTGVTYTLGIWLKGNVGGEALTISLRDSGSGVTSLPIVLTTTWQFYTISRANWSSSGTAQPSIVATSLTALNFWSTGFCLVADTTLAEYFDGSFPGCFWNGVAYNSTSRRPASGGPRLQAIMADIEQVVTLMSRNHQGTIRRIFPTASGSNRRVTYDVVNAQLSWDDTSMMNAGIAKGTITFEAEPYARGPELTTWNDNFIGIPGGPPTNFNDIPFFYTVDAGAASNVNGTTGSGLNASANLTTENRFIYTGGEYPWYAGEVAAEFDPGTTISGWKGGVILQRFSATTYMEAYVTDNGTNSILNLDKVVAGARTNLATATLGARIVTGTSYSIRARIQRQGTSDNVLVEYFTSTLGNLHLNTAVTTSLSYTLNTGTSDANFSTGTPFATGMVWVPQSTNANIHQFSQVPNLARERTNIAALRFAIWVPPGTAQSLGRMLVSDNSGNDQFYLRWGQQHMSGIIAGPTLGTDLFYEAEALTPQNGASVVTGNAGASGAGTNNVVRQTGLTTTPITMLSTGATNMGHTGDFEVYARVFPAAANAGFTSVALAWGTGDLRSQVINASTVVAAVNTGAATVHSLGGYWVVDLGSIRTTGSWQGQILASSTGPGDTVDIDALWLVPLTDGAGQGKATPNQITGTLVARDEFNQATGALNGKTAPVGGLWADAGTATDYQTNGPSAHTLSRTSSSDAAPELAVSGAAAATNLTVRLDAATSLWGGTTPSFGILARYVNSTNYLYYVLTSAVLNGGAYLVVSKVIGGVTTGLAAKSIGTIATGTYTSLWLSVDARGRFWGWYGAQGNPVTLALSGYDSTLATSGTLASGQVGIYDINFSATSSVRDFQNFASWPYLPDAAIFNSGTAQLSSSAMIRGGAGGAGLPYLQTPNSFGASSPESSYVGQYLKLPIPSTEDQLVYFIVKTSRTDPLTMSDPAIDAVEAQVSVTPRYVQIPNF